MRVIDDIEYIINYKKHLLKKLEKLKKENENDEKSNIDTNEIKYFPQIEGYPFNYDKKLKFINNNENRYNWIFNQIDKGQLYLLLLNKNISKNIKNFNEEIKIRKKAIKLDIKIVLEKLEKYENKAENIESIKKINLHCETVNKNSENQYYNDEYIQIGDLINKCNNQLESDYKEGIKKILDFNQDNLKNKVEDLCIYEKRCYTYEKYIILKTLENLNTRLEFLEELESQVEITKNLKN